MFNSNHMSILRRLGDIATRKFSPSLLALDKILPTPLPRADFSQNRITSSVGQRKGSHQK